MGDRFADGHWVETFTGRRVPVLDPHASDIDIQDVAHALSMTCRYNGHVRQFYSVAEHSVLLSDYALMHHGPLAGLVMLLHDAAEAYMGDIVRPLKSRLDVDSIEANLEWAVFMRFGLQNEVIDGLPLWARELDDRIVVDEHRRVMNCPRANDWSTDGLKPLGVRIRCLEPWQAKREFLDRFARLRAA